MQASRVSIEGLVRAINVEFVCKSVLLQTICIEPDPTDAHGRLTHTRIILLARQKSSDIVNSQARRCTTACKTGKLWLLSMNKGREYV